MTPPAVTAFVGMGSNLGPREEHLRRAAEALATVPGVILRRVSAIHETAPVGGPPQGPYLNAAAELEVVLEPEALLEALQRIEAAAGRERGVRWGPRTLDLDLLLYGDGRIDRPGLVVPHPRMAGRAFVLRPLAELAPDRAIPGAGGTVRDCLMRLESAPVSSR